MIGLSHHAVEPDWLSGVAEALKVALIKMPLVRVSGEVGRGFAETDMEVMQRVIHGVPPCIWSICTGGILRVRLLSPWILATGPPTSWSS